MSVVFINGVTGGAGAFLFRRFQISSPFALVFGRWKHFQEMSEPSNDLRTYKPFTSRQIAAVNLRVDGYSWDAISKELHLTERTLRTWRKHPEWDERIAERRKQWIDEYENAFTRMMPRVAAAHSELLCSQSEGIRMRAVDSAHANHVRCVKEQDTRSEIEALAEMVHRLTEQLAQERAKS